MDLLYVKNRITQDNSKVFIQSNWKKVKWPWERLQEERIELWGKFSFRFFKD